MRISKIHLRAMVRRMAVPALAAVVLMLPTPLFGQGCSTCYTTAAAAKDVAIRALRHGILILALPPVVIFAAIVGFAWRTRDPDR